MSDNIFGTTSTPNLLSVAEVAAKVMKLDEISMEAGKVYHQDSSDGKMFFKAVEQQKNKRWKGLVLDIGQKKPKNGSADEKLRFWQVTSDKDVPPSLKEEVEITETIYEKKSKKNTFGMAPFKDLKNVADAALKIMTGQPQEVKEEEKEEVTKEDQPQVLTEQIV
jgi:hypothetical protein